MDKKKIKLILDDLLEEEVPSSQVNLWPEIKADLHGRKQRLLPEEGTMIARNMRQIPISTVAIITIIILLTFSILTPQGWSVAQSLMQFFQRAENTTFPLQSTLVSADVPELGLPTIEPPTPLISLNEAEAQVGFSALQPQSVPDGYNYLGVRLYGDVISIEYEADGGGSNLSIKESQDDYYQSGWDQVPEDAIVAVKVGVVDGEFAQGTFVVYPGKDHAVWNDEAPIMRLRWIQNGIWLEMAKYGNVEVVEYLDQAGMVALAEKMSTLP